MSYILMNEENSGSAPVEASTEPSASSCNFQTETTSRSRYLQSNQNVESSTLVYMSEYGMSTIKQMLQLR